MQLCKGDAAEEPEEEEEEEEEEDDDVNTAGVVNASDRDNHKRNALDFSSLAVASPAIISYFPQRISIQHTAFQMSVSVYVLGKGTVFGPQCPSVAIVRLPVCREKPPPPPPRCVLGVPGEHRHAICPRPAAPLSGPEFAAPFDRIPKLLQWRLRAVMQLSHTWAELRTGTDITTRNICLRCWRMSLCITPDTLAFNAHGNVCFMEQLSAQNRKRDGKKKPQEEKMDEKKGRREQEMKKQGMDNRHEEKQTMRGQERGRERKGKKTTERRGETMEKALGEERKGKQSKEKDKEKKRRGQERGQERKGKKKTGREETMGHVYSLGSTLSAALNFVIEPELEAELGEEIQKLLEQMQEENPEDRPLLQMDRKAPGRQGGSIRHPDVYLED
ncbi:hypothetical protein F2P81_019932 [Scophthalmus maximus]|uniref:KIND domain-containing protein n=1 Tax=Scophthalmus maximus TaxID=52904 RepID=A0A6A4S7W8_SCOMX|nr:hypothetical protein F2P81_019932 [Scophthalmus maximus]